MSDFYKAIDLVRMSTRSDISSTLSAHLLRSSPGDEGYLNDPAPPRRGVRTDAIGAIVDESMQGGITRSDDVSALITRADD